MRVSREFDEPDLKCLLATGKIDLGDVIVAAVILFNTFINSRTSRRTEQNMIKASKDLEKMVRRAERAQLSKLTLNYDTMFVLVQPMCTAELAKRDGTINEWGCIFKDSAAEIWVHEPEVGGSKPSPQSLN